MAQGNRKAATAWLLDFIDSLNPGSPNRKIYQDRLAVMSDEEFDVFVNDIDSGKESLVYYSPNGFGDNSLSVERNLEIAKALGHDFFQYMILTDPDTGVVFETNNRYLVVDLPVRRQAQTLEKKVSIPENDQHTDQLTDQPTGPSKGSKISFPELQILYGQGYDRTIEELIKFRGGDTKAYQLLKTLAMTDGVVSQDNIKQVQTQVKSTEVVGTVLTAMHLGNNLSKTPGL